MNVLNLLNSPKASKICFNVHHINVKSAAGVRWSGWGHDGGTLMHVCSRPCRLIFGFRPGRFVFRVVTNLRLQNSSFMVHGL